MFRRVLPSVAFALVVLLIASMVAAVEGVQEPGGDPASQSTATIGGSDAATSGSPTHVIASKTTYYATGPQQGRAPDGEFPAGTRVRILREAGSYTLVQAENGVRAYVAADSLQPLPGTAGAVKAIVEGGNQFALQLYSHLAESDGNLFFSPSSISLAMAMTHAGAAGKTEQQMAKTLHFDLPKPELNEGMQKLLSVWNSQAVDAGYRLAIANRLWAAKGYEFLPQFLNVTRADYGAELARLDFHQVEAARNTINRWVEEKTAGKIRDLIPPGAVNANSKLVLTNAVYFKGEWTKKFEKNRTKEEDFHVSVSSKVKSHLMHQQEQYRYASVEGLQVLELPYGNKDLAMIVLLPDKIDGLPELESHLSLENLHRWCAALRPREVEVSLPRFKMTAMMDLNRELEKMGMPDAFDPSTANFAGMTGSRDLFISRVVHQAFVDVHEEGTEAAAATGVIVAVTSLRIERPKPVFRADHPFVFMIRDNRNGTILFLGRLLDPSA